MKIGTQLPIKLSWTHTRERFWTIHWIPLSWPQTTVFQEVLQYSLQYYNVWGNLHGYYFQLLGVPFHYDVLGGSYI